MAKRPVFIIKLSGMTLVDIIDVEFQWFPGVNSIQKQKSLHSLHSAYIKKYKESKILEVLSKSELELGKKLSALSSF